MSSSEAVEIAKAIIAVIGTLGVAGLAFMGVVYQSRKPSKTKLPVGDTTTALERFDGNQNEFMTLVIADNRSLRNDINDLNDKFDKISEELEDVRRNSETFVTAVRRYLYKLASAWGQGGPMPWPDDNDFHILEDALPNRTGIIERKDN